MNNGQRQTGFTLVEVAIALAILAIVLAAVGRATHTAVAGTHALRNQTFAQWVAENRVARRYAARAWIAPGVYSGTESQASIEFQWREQVSVTPNPTLLRLDVTVAMTENPERTLATMAGFIALERD